MSDTRYIFLDDTHPDLVYEGAWEIDTNLYEGVRDDIYRGSQHRTTGTASVSVTFFGTEMGIHGRIESKSSGDEITFPSWRCFIDDEEFPRRDNITHAFTVNTYTYCGTPTGDLRSVSPGEHTLRMEVDTTPEHPAFVDYFWTKPLIPSVRNLSLTDYTARATAADPSFRFGPDWERDDDLLIRWTDSTSTFAELIFVGTRVMWIGTALDSQPRGQSVGHYILNGGEPVSFNIPGYRGFEVGEITYFETPLLPRNRHNLTVFFDGFEAPLMLDEIRVTDGDIVFRDARALGPELDGFYVAEVEKPAEAPKQSSTPIGAIVGGVVGGIVLLALLGLGFFFYKRNQNKANGSGGGETRGMLEKDVNLGGAVGVAPFDAGQGLAYGAHIMPPNPHAPPNPRALSEYGSVAGGVGGAVYSKGGNYGQTPVVGGGYQPQFGVDPARVHSVYYPAPANSVAGGSDSAGGSIAYNPHSPSGPVIHTTPSTGFSNAVSPKAQMALAAQQPQQPAMYHQDSGIRINPAGGSAQVEPEALADVPPTYSEK